MVAFLSENSVIKTGFKSIKIWDSEDKSSTKNLLATAQVPNFGRQTSNAVQSGVYRFWGIAEVTGNAAEDGTTETKTINSERVQIDTNCCLRSAVTNPLEFISIRAPIDAANAGVEVIPKDGYCA